MIMTQIEVKGLTKTYKTYERGAGLREAFRSLFRRKQVLSQAVKSISFSIEPGETVGFVGPNGAGKSTTIKMLTGILYPTSGEARIMGRIPWMDRQHYVRDIGVVFGQKSQLWMDLPPIDAFYLNKDIFKVPESEFEERLSTMTRLLKVEDVIRKPTRNLSLGERMKCEFIMALLHNPKILFLDEPTIGVDALAKEEIRNFLLHVNKAFKTTILLTTHDMDDIEELCKRIMIIDNGELIYDGDLKVVKERYVHWKTVDFEFLRINDKKAFSKILSKGTVQTDGPRFKSIRFDKRSVSVPLAVRELMESCELIDLAVHEPRLEHVIKEIYGDKASRSS